MSRSNKVCSRHSCFTCTTPVPCLNKVRSRHSCFVVRPGSCLVRSTWPPLGGIRSAVTRISKPWCPGTAQQARLARFSLQADLGGHRRSLMANPQCCHQWEHEAREPGEQGLCAQAALIFADSWPPCPNAESASTWNVPSFRGQTVWMPLG